MTRHKTESFVIRKTTVEIELILLTITPDKEQVANCIFLQKGRLI